MRHRTPILLSFVALAALLLGSGASYDSQAGGPAPDPPESLPVYASPTLQGLGDRELLQPASAGFAT